MEHGVQVPGYHCNRRGAFPALERCPEQEDISAGADKNGSELYRPSTVSELYTFSNIGTSAAPVLVSNAKLEAEARQPTDVALWSGGEKWWATTAQRAVSFMRDSQARGPGCVGFRARCEISRAIVA